MFYTYVHRRPDTGAIFYVGKGSGRRAYSLKQRSRFWRAVIEKAGGFEVEIVFQGDEAACLAEEVRLIALHGRRDLGTGQLVNLTAGGDGLLTPGAETRTKMSERRRGRKWTAAEHEAAKRRCVTAETRAKMSASAMGKVKSPEHVANLVKALKERTSEQKAETAAKIRAKTAGSKNHTARAVIATHPDGTEERFNCAKELIDKYDLHQSEVSKCCRGKRSSHRGLKVRFADGS